MPFTVAACTASTILTVEGQAGSAKSDLLCRIDDMYASKDNVAAVPVEGVDLVA
jgi:hypothetical protein